MEIARFSVCIDFIIILVSLRNRVDCMHGCKYASAAQMTQEEEEVVSSKINYRGKKSATFFAVASYSADLANYASQ